MRSIFSLTYICAMLFSMNISAQEAKFKPRTGSPYFFSAKIFQEVEMFSPNYPYGASADLKISRLYLHGHYRFTSSRVTEVQMVPAGDSYGAKVGIMGGNRIDDDISLYGFSLGYDQVNTLKRLNMAGLPLPQDYNGKKYEVENSLVYYNGICYSAGVQFCSYTRKAEKSLEALEDDFDLDWNGSKKRQTFIQGSLMFLYMPDVSFNQNIVYSPYGTFLPKEIMIGDVARKRKYGVSMRFEVATFTGIGFLMEMALLPGISSVTTENENDFNMSTKAGISYNFFYVR